MIKGKPERFYPRTNEERRKLWEKKKAFKKAHSFATFPIFIYFFED